jgi:two-component system response regulator RegA
MDGSNMSEKPVWLLVDDDESFLQVLQRSLERRGIESVLATTPNAAMNALADSHIWRCVLDLNIGGESGLRLLPRLLEIKPELEVVVLTGYGSIATTTEAMRRGAVNYLCKPVTLGQLLAGFEPLNEPPEIRKEPPSVEEMEWEHIQRILNENNGNVSATARALNMHRRTLQRKLYKHSSWRQ